MKKIISVIAAAVLVGFFLGAAGFGIVKFLQKEPQLPSVPLAESDPEMSGCYIKNFFAYSGKNPENGSFERVSDVAAIAVKNYSGHDIKYAEITVKTQGGDYVFLATTLLAGSEMTVLEKTGAKLYDTFSFLSAEITAGALFDEAPSLHEDSLAIAPSGNGFSVKNISGSDINGTVSIYFKTCDENGYFGGITYKTDIDGIKAGEEKTVSAELDTDNRLEAVFVTVSQEE